MGDVRSRDVMTPARIRVLEVIAEYQAMNGIAPTVREIQKACGYRSPRAVTHHLAALEEMGHLKRRPNRARAVRLQRPRRYGSRRAFLPVYGRIPAGPPDANAAEAAEENLSLDPVMSGLARTSAAYALRVRGDSMEGAGILDGDLVVVEPAEPKPGDIVVALIDGESTLKRYVRKRRRPCLVSENPRYADLVPAAELTIQGVVTGLLRRIR